MKHQLCTVYRALYSVQCTRLFLSSLYLLLATATTWLQCRNVFFVLFYYFPFHCRWLTVKTLLQIPITWTVKSLPIDAAKTLIQAFISNRLDYCNAALCGITDTLLRKLQSVQNAAAWLLTRTGRREHITPVLRQLHCLAVSRRIDFNLTVLMYHISRGLAPTYLQDRCRLATEVSSGRRLRSANVPTFVVPCMRTKLRDRSFAAAGPRLWNSLPGPLRQSKTLTTFKRQLKTFLFSD